MTLYKTKNGVTFDRPSERNTLSFAILANLVATLRRIMESIRDMIPNNYPGSIHRMVIGIFGLVSLRHIFWMIYYKYYRYPPYFSLGVPFLGCLHLFAVNPKKFLLSKVCNNGKMPITTVPFGKKSVVFVNDIKTAKHVLKNEFIGPNRNEPIHVATERFGFANGKKWKTFRDLVQSSFIKTINSSFVSSTMEEVLEQEIFRNHIDENLNRPMFMRELCSFTAYHVVMYSVFGNKLKNKYNANNWFYKSMLKLFSGQIIPFSMYTAYETLIGIRLPLCIFWTIFSSKRHFRKMRLETRKMLIENDVLHKVESNKYEWNKSYKNDAKSAVITDVIEKNMNIDETIENIEFVLFAGMETTGKTMEYGLVMLCKYPSIQKRIFDELQTCDGYSANLLNSKLHCLKAFVFEILRHFMVTPLGLPHCCYGGDVEVDGYKIYDGTQVFINYLAIHYGNEENGKKFNIDRWLDKKGKFNTNYQRESFMAFGHGIRSCAGQNIAKQELFAFFAFVIQKYIVYNDDLPKEIPIHFSMVLEIKPEIPIYFKPR